MLEKRKLEKRDLHKPLGNILEHVAEFTNCHDLELEKAMGVKA
jgi:hypothetical protein